MIEFLMAMGQNFIGTATVLAFGSGIFLFVSRLGELISGSNMETAPYETEKKNWTVWYEGWTKLRSISLKIFIPTMLLALVPSPDKVWEMRIALIKFHLADPENVQKAADKIAEIGHKLECKYIGCKEPKEKE